MSITLRDTPCYGARMDIVSPYLTVDEYAALVRVPAETIRRLIRTGKLEVVRVGSQYRLLPPTPGPIHAQKSA